MSQSRISFVVPSEKLGDLLNVLSGEYSDLRVEPVDPGEAPAPEEPKKRNVPPRNTPYIDTGLPQIVLDYATGAGPVQVADMAGVLVEKGKSANSITAVLSNLKFLNVVKFCEDKASFEIAHTSEWRKCALTVTSRTLAQMRKEEGQK